MALGSSQPLTEMSTRNVSWGQRWPVHRADNLITFMCWLSWNLGASPCWNPQGLSRPVMGLLYLLTGRTTFYLLIFCTNPHDKILTVNLTKIIRFFNRQLIPARYNCVLFLTTLMMVTWVAETCRWLLCNKLTFQHSSAPVDISKIITPPVDIFSLVIMGKT